MRLSWTPDGKSVAYISGKCIRTVGLDLSQDIITCFESGEFLEGFDFSFDGTQIGISLNREVFLIPYDLEALQVARNRNDLIALAVCEHFAPIDRGSAIIATDVRWSRDGQQIALLVRSPGASGLQEDLIQVFDISSCVERLPRVDEFPGTRFIVDQFDVVPRLPDWDWNGDTLFTLNSQIRNGTFGDLYRYFMDRFRGDKINPIEGRCCYMGARFSPDGRYVFFAFQDFALGASSVTVYFYVDFAALESGAELIPLDFPPLIDQREIPQVAIRAAQTP
jgi:hypothetical protein